MALRFFTGALILYSLVAATTRKYKVRGSSQTVKAFVGQDVILPCHVEPPCNLTHRTVEWRVNETTIHVYRNGQDSTSDQDKAFKDRTSLFHDDLNKGNISLKLFNVSVTDSGTFMCYVPKLDGPVKKGNVKLIVAAADFPQDTEPTPPSPQRSHTAITVPVGVGVVIVVVIVTTILLKKYCNTRS